MHFSTPVAAGILADKALNSDFYRDDGFGPLREDASVDADVTVTVCTAQKYSWPDTSFGTATMSGGLVPTWYSHQPSDPEIAKKLVSIVKALGRDNAPIAQNQTTRGTAEPRLSCQYVANLAGALGKPSTKSVYSMLAGATAEGASNDALFHRAATTLRRRISLSLQAETLENLHAGWDGYSAAPIGREVITQIIRDLNTALENTHCSTPELVPGADGSVQAEWNDPNFEVSYTVSADGEKFFWTYDRQKIEEFSRRGEDAQAALRHWAVHVKG